MHETNDRFHLTLFGACGNKYLVQTIELYMRFSLPVRANSMGDRASLQVSHSQHRLMIDMLQGRDSWLLAQLCVDHLQPSKRRYIEQVGGGEVARSPPSAVNGDSLNAQTCTTHARSLGAQVRARREVNGGSPLEADQRDALARQDGREVEPAVGDLDGPRLDRLELAGRLEPA